jgi:hypothetical protein
LTPKTHTSRDETRYAMESRVNPRMTVFCVAGARGGCVDLGRRVKENGNFR